MKEASAYLGTLEPNKPITIIGGGISGLITGHYLQKANIPFTLFEQNDHIGGKIKTTINQHGVYEHAANAIYSSDLIFEILEDLKLTPIYPKNKLKKFVWRNGRPTSPPLSFREILRLIPKVFIYTPNQMDQTLTVGEFFEPLLGRTLVGEVLTPALTGVYAEDAYKLHHQSIFQIPPSEHERYINYFLRLKRAKKKQKRSPKSLSFENGLSELTQALRKSLGANIKTNQKLTKLSTTNTIIATDATDAADILEATHPVISNELKKISYSTLSLVHIFSKYNLSYLDHAFGMVFKPNSSKRNLIGLLRNDQIFPKKVTAKDTYSYSFILQGNNNIDRALSSDLQEIKAQEIKKKELDSKTFSWKRAIPIYNYERFLAIQKIRKELKKSAPGVVIHGNYIHGVSLRQIIENTHEFVSNLAKITS